jgi:hypothetical protein
MARSDGGSADNRRRRVPFIKGARANIEQVRCVPFVHFRQRVIERKSLINLAAFD